MMYNDEVIRALFIQSLASAHARVDATDAPAPPRCVGRGTRARARARARRRAAELSSTALLPGYCTTARLHDRADPGEWRRCHSASLCWCCGRQQRQRRTKATPGEKPREVAHQSLILCLSSACAPCLRRRLQYVGFPVQTGYNGYLGPNMLYYGENNGLGSYVGLNDIEEDIDARIEIMRAAINASASNSSVDNRGDTLKVFLAPEFFMNKPPTHPC